MPAALNNSAAHSQALEDQREERRKKRVITTKRKEQNREAQKRYREKKRTELDEKTSNGLAEYGHISNVEETFPTLNEINGTDFSTFIGLGGLNFGNDSTLETIMSRVSPSSDTFSGPGDFSSFLYEQQSFLDSSPNWQCPTPMTVRTTSLQSVDSQELEEVSISPQKGSASSITTLPSPYKNHLRLNRLCLYAACHENVVQMGISIEIAKTPRCPSPFYQSPPLSSQEPTLISHQISKRCEANLRLDLRPSTIQRTHPHEIYLDVYPFPKWRDKVIQLLSLSPPAFDEMELKRDLDKDGLICWGSISGKGSGAPWDSRSWEAQKWFLEKWWFITKNSGVDTQSEWWRMMRGEDEDDQIVI